MIIDMQQVQISDGLLIFPVAVVVAQPAAGVVPGGSPPLRETVLLTGSAVNTQSITGTIDDSEIQPS